jgi:hypothetical protein
MGQVSSVLCLFEVVTRGGVFHERSIKIVSRSLQFAQILEHVTDGLMVTTLE